MRSSRPSRRPSARALGIALVVAVLAAAGWLWLAPERPRGPGDIVGPGRAAERVDAAMAARERARAAVDEAARMEAPPEVFAGGPEDAGADEPGKLVLFGDLHVHTTYSIDAFVFSLPLFGGGGVHPPADACDFARYCSQLDFFSINDHAEGLFPERWDETIESIRQCNARAGDPDDPDLVAYVGWEWTQVGATPETHYGHRNVIYPGLSRDELPARPIASLAPGTTEGVRGMWIARGLSELGPLGLGSWADFLWHISKIADTPTCEPGVDTRELPEDCRENAQTPAELFEKLAQWDLPALVIPHGLAWGVHAPAGSRLDVLQANGNHDPDVERLLEVFSGHGNSEAYRDLPTHVTDADGLRVCPEPTPDFLPCCWRAGEIVRARCGDLPEAECEARVREARRLALDAGPTPERILPDVAPEEWLDCDQCRDCFKPARILRPHQSAQYGLVLSGKRGAERRARSEPQASEVLQGAGKPAEPARSEPQASEVLQGTVPLRWGFVASSDNHSSRAGSGYKQVARTEMTDARGYASPFWHAAVERYVEGTQEDPRRAQRAPDPGQRSMRGLLDVERGASFMYTGGLVAVHSASRDRHAIFDALRRREVYGTSGPRILLWFDLLNAPDGRAPMGSAAEMDAAPVFEVRAVGARVQQPGCPEASVRGLGPERVQRLCRGECHHPGDARHPIEAIEVVRVRPRISPDEDAALLIEDPWRRFACEPTELGCVVRFDDPEYATSGRDAVYYVRALQEPTPAVNGASLRTELGPDGEAVSVTPCYGGYRTDASDDCLAPVRERAWSSPIFVDRPRS